MIRDFAKKIDCEIPEHLKDLVVGVILGRSQESLSEVIPMYASGYAVLFHIFGTQPFISINGQKQERKSRIIVAGQICDATIKYHIQGVLGQIGVVLYPTATYYLLHKPGEYFLNTWRTLEETSASGVYQLTQKLNRVDSLEERLRTLLNYLTILEKQRLPVISWLDASLEKVFSRNGNVSQRELIKDSHVTARHFRRTFKKVIGVSPKYYCKIIQLATVFELLNNSEKEKLHHLALDCGYYDQSHFIRDFQKLIGRSPEDFMNGKYSYLSTYMGRRGI